MKSLNMIEYTPPERPEITNEIMDLVKYAWKEGYMQRSAVDLVYSQTQVSLSIEEMDKLYYHFNMGLS